MCHPDMQMLINAANFILQEIQKHPNYKALDYQPDVTITDAQAALSYLQCELDSKREASVVSESSV